MFEYIASLTPGDWFMLVLFAASLAVVFWLLGRAALELLEHVILPMLLWLAGVVLGIAAWSAFVLTFWYIPKNPESRTLETSMFFVSHLWLGRTLYEHNLAWRRDLSKYRAAVRSGGAPLPRFRFSWRTYFRTVLS
jgi:hypothetical protein